MDVLPFIGVDKNVTFKFLKTLPVQV